MKQYKCLEIKKQNLYTQKQKKQTVKANQTATINNKTQDNNHIKSIKRKQKKE